MSFRTDGCHESNPHNVSDSTDRDVLPDFTELSKGGKNVSDSTDRDVLPDFKNDHS